MRSQYKILSEKYQNVAENDKEDILAGMDEIMQQQAAKRKQIQDLALAASEALDDLEEAVSELYETGEQSQDWSEAITIMGDQGVYGEELYHTAWNIRSMEKEIYGEDDI